MLQANKMTRIQKKQQPVCVVFVFLINMIIMIWGSITARECLLTLDNPNSKTLVTATQHLLAYTYLASVELAMEPGPSMFFHFLQADLELCETNILYRLVRDHKGTKQWWGVSSVFSKYDLEEMCWHGHIVLSYHL